MVVGAGRGAYLGEFSAVGVGLGLGPLCAGSQVCADGGQLGGSLGAEVRQHLLPARTTTVEGLRLIAPMIIPRGL